MFQMANRTPFYKMPSSKNKINNYYNVNSSEISHLTPNDSIRSVEKSTNINRKTTTKKFKVLLWNCNGACKKFNALKLLVQEEKADLICLNEIKCLDQEANGEMQVNGYTTLFKCRTAKGGGVAMIVNNKIKFDQIVIPSSINEEIIGITIKFKKVKLSFFTIYNPPKKKIGEACFEFIKTFGNFVILGDLNAKIPQLNKLPNQNGIILDKLIQDIDALVVNNPNYPTNFHLIDGRESNSIIDLAIISAKVFPLYKSCITLFDSAVDIYHKKYFHVPVVLSFIVEQDKQTTERDKCPPYNYQKANWVMFRESIDEELLKSDQMLKLNDLNEICSELMLIIKASADKAIPVIKKSSRIVNFPPEIMELIRLKNSCKKMYQKTESLIDKENLDSIKSILAYELEDFHSKKWNNFCKGLGKNILSTVPFWKRIARLKNESYNNKISTLRIDGVEYDEDQEKCQLFADNLEKTFSNEYNSKFNQEVHSSINQFLETPLELIYKDKKIPEFSMKELNKQLKRLNKKTSTDQDRISNRILKEIPESFKKKLLTLFNNCLLQGKIPSYWKKSIISMLSKKNSDKHSTKGYRPISILPCISRLFERLLLHRITKILNKNKIIIKQQSGFRHGRQTHDNLIYFTQKILEGFGKKENSLGIFFDVSSAFDKVWHNGLIYKCIKYKLPYYIIRILVDYLKDRSFTVKIGNSFSTSRVIEAGVPQGGVLSPTLFSLFINDLPVKTDYNSQEFSFLFADDISYLTSSKNLINDQGKIQEYINLVVKWMDDWRLCLAPHKCVFSIFSRDKRNRLKENLFNFKIHDNNIKFDPNPKFLGIKFDRYMNGSAQVNEIKDKVKSRLNLLKILSYKKNWQLNEKTLINMYKSLVRSITDYSAYLSCFIPTSMSEQLERVQNSALRIIFKTKLSDRIASEKLRKKAHVETIKVRQIALLKKYFTKVRNNQNELMLDLINSFQLHKKQSKTDTSKSSTSKTILCSTVQL